MSYYSPSATTLILAQRRENAALRAERDVYKKALRKIRREEGKVCSEYEICHHGSCESSYNSWAIADGVLNWGVKWDG